MYLAILDGHGAYYTLPHRNRGCARFRQGPCTTVPTVMVQAERSTFTNKRNQTISTVSYLPENIHRPKAVLFFHHGYGEHIGRYERGMVLPTYT